MKKINDGSKVLVFCETKKGVDDLTRMMRNDGWHAVKGIHGDKTQYVISIIIIIINIGERPDLQRI